MYRNIFFNFLIYYPKLLPFKTPSIRSSLPLPFLQSPNSLNSHPPIILIPQLSFPIVK